LNDANANCKEEKGQPLERGQLAAEEKDGESGSGKNFHLVGNLERGGFQIRGGNKLKIILNDCRQDVRGRLNQGQIIRAELTVKYSRNRQLPAVGPKNLLSDNSTPL
jgi:hypothetical protein